MGEAAEVHPAEDLADTDLAHRLDVLRHRLGGAEGQRLGNEALPGDLREALGQRAEGRLEAWSWPGGA